MLESVVAMRCDGWPPLRAKLCRAALALAFLLAPGVLRSAAACSCDAHPPCAAVWRADAIFVGTVVERGSERVGGTLSVTVHKVAIHQTLRGSVDSFITLLPAARPTAQEIAASQSRPGQSVMMSTCDYDFEPGRQYVIYARRTPEGRWTTSMCTGTKPIEEASADFDYIASIPLAQPTGRVYGKIERTILNPKERTEALNVPASGVRIALASQTHRLTLTSDSDGQIDVQVPPGEYTIAPVVPQTVRVYGTMTPASVPARGCVPVHFSLISNGRVEGRVVRPDGTPAARASVDVIPADLPPDERPESFTTAPAGTTDENGRFAVDAILPGRYVVAVNARFGPRLFSPYRTTYFPGVVARQDAKVIEIDDGERRTGFNIMVTPLAETTVSGVVVSDDDRPVAEANVTAALADDRSMIMQAAKTDAGGAFELRLLAGLSYLITARLRTAQGLKQVETVLFLEQRREDLRLLIDR